MAPRSQLQTVLSSIPSVKAAYFQPPATMRMEYPCIVYERSKIDTRFADNSPYLLKTRYSLTVIDRNPDSGIQMQVAQLPLCTHDRSFRSDGLNHDSFVLYF